MPTMYEQYDLTHIIMSKAYGYHTGFDDSVRYFFQARELLTRIISDKKRAEYIVYKSMLLWMGSSTKMYRQLKNEIPIKFNLDKNSLTQNIDLKKRYNVLYANMRQYLRPLVCYMNESELDNHLIIVPRFLENDNQLKGIDSNKVLVFENFVSKDIMAEYLNAKDQFIKIYETNIDRIKDIFTINLYDFFRLHQVGIRNIFMHLLPQAVLFSLTFEKILNEIKVSSTIGCRVRRIFDRSMHVCCQKYNIKNFILPHADIVNDVKRLNTMGHFNYITGVFAWNKSQKTAIEMDKFSNVEEIYLTGSPLFSRSSFKNLIKSNNNKRVLYAASINDVREVKLILKVLSKMKTNIQLLIKVHPSGGNKLYDKISNADNVQILNSYENLDDWIDLVDIFITTASQSCFQSMLKGIPTIFLLVYNINDWSNHLYSIIRLNEDENLLIAHNRRELRDTLNSLYCSVEYRTEYLSVQENFLRRRLNYGFYHDSSSKNIDKIISL